MFYNAALLKILFIWATLNFTLCIGVAASESTFNLSGKVHITKITDGDSLRSNNLKIRLFGIDALELRQQCKDSLGRKWSCGIAARSKLQDLVSRAPYLYCALRDVDRYGRLVMKCFAGNTDIGEAMVKSGYALAYQQYALDYLNQEKEAQELGRGIWSSDFMPPWDWRKTQ